MKQKISILLAALLCCTFFIGCENTQSPASNTITEPTSESTFEKSTKSEIYDLLTSENIQYIEVDYMETKEWVQKLSLISPEYDLEQILSIFDINENIKKGKTPVIKDIGGVCFYPGDDKTKTSGYLYKDDSQDIDEIEDFFTAVRLALYTFDQENLKNSIKNSNNSNNEELKNEIEKKNSSGRLLYGNDISLISALILKISSTSSNINVEELEHTYGILPEDISDTQKNKYAYYGFETTVILNDIPFSYAEVHVPNGSVKIFLDEEGDNLYE